MAASVLLIAVGLIAILWGHWWVPRQLRQVRERATPQGLKRYDRLMTPAAMSRLRRTSVIAGGMTVLIGVVYLIMEL
jgi:hypothetical protein